VRVLTLDQDFFIKNREEIEGLEDAIIECEDTVEAGGTPLCDFQKFYKANSLREKLQRAKEKAVLLKTSVVLRDNPLFKNATPRKSSILDLWKNHTQKHRMSIVPGRRKRSTLIGPHNKRMIKKVSSSHQKQRRPIFKKSS